MSGPQEKHTSTLSALRYLRGHAIDAHYSGDGMQVLHHCTVALNRVVDNSTTDGAERIALSSVRWAFFLGLYWLLDDWFLYIIEKAIKSVVSDEPSEHHQHDLSVVQYLFTTLQTPLQYHSPATLLALPPEYLAARAADAEDLGALSLAVEVAWYQSPTSGEWAELVEKWAQHLPDDALLRKELILLSSRLKAQTSLLLGAAATNANEPDSSDWPQEQQWLMKGWQLYHNCAFDELDLLLSELTPRLDTEGPAYPLFFTLFHWSRMYRKEREEQCLSLSRRNLVVSRQPASVFREVLGDRFAEPYSTLARKGFPDGAAHERLNAFRIAMLVQLHGLRSWDIGAWRMGEAHRAQACLELGARGDVNFAREGVIRAVRSNTIEDPGKYPHLDVCVQLLDALPEKQRAEVVTELLASPRNNWPSVHRVLKQLSDAIPVDLLEEAATWSARFELDEFHSRHAITYLDFWHIILQWAPNAEDLVAALLPALVKDASNPACWRFLHNEFISAIVKGSENVARELVARILDVSCEQRNWNEHRFSILYNVAKECPPLRETCIPWLQEYVQTGDDAEYQQYLLRNWERDDEGPVNDSHFREWLRRSILAYCDKCLQEKGPYSIGGVAYHRMVRDVTWPRGDRELVDRLIAVADAEHVPFLNKVDPIACIAYLAKAGTKVQAKRIARAATRWLDEGIKGHDIGIGGPLSVAQMFGAGADSVLHPLMLLVEVFAEQYPDVLGRPLATWVLTEGLRRPAGVVAEIVRIALNLSIYFQDDDSALSLALVGTAEAVAHSTFGSEAAKAVAGFRSVVFPKACPASTHKWRTSASGRLCMDMWARRLCEGAQLPNPSARREVALCIRDWRQADTIFPGALVNLDEQLRKDPRLRVRSVLNQGDEQDEG